MPNTSFTDLVNKGVNLYDSGKYSESVKIFKTALLLYKNLNNSAKSSLYVRLGNAYYKLDDRDNYVNYYEKYLQYYPEGQANVFLRLAQAYYYFDADKCIDYHNKALNIKPMEFDSATKLFAMTKSVYYNQEYIKNEAEYETEQLKKTVFKNIKKFNHDEKKRNPDKKLNIAYLSSDCRYHTMMNYMLPIWENHNKEKFNFFIFNGSAKEDDVTKKIENLGFEVIKCSDMSIEQTAQEIYKRNIDILVDISGYTHMKVYAALYKPAPVIISYLGYLNTTGLKEIDYILTDRYSIPEDKAYLYTEKPLYLDKGYQIYINRDIPTLTDSPFKTNGYITFASFNCPSKINDAVIYMWSRILKDLPNSKLLIYRNRLTKNIIQYIGDKFVKEGIPLDRLMFDNRKFKTYFNVYSLADISLDTYPFNGMSLAIENALTGVPTVTLTGECMQSRGTGRINHIIGHDELNASDCEEYIKIAVDLAKDKERLENYRKNLREKVNNSDLIQNAAEFTGNLEDKYLTAWKTFTDSP